MSFISLTHEKENFINLDNVIFVDFYYKHLNDEDRDTNIVHIKFVSIEEVMVLKLNDEDFIRLKNLITN